MALINFSLPIIPSFVKTEPDKLIDVKLWDGSITQQLLFIPDIKILSNFFKGDIGIADSIMKKMMIGNLSKIKSPDILESFLKAAGGKLPKPFESYFKDGKLSINPSELSITNIPGNLGGLKALEKSLITSIFETKKPYIEIIKLVLENLVKIEDIIARVLAISGSSMNPKNNPKALGYQGNNQFKENVAKLDGFKNSDTGPKNDNTDENTDEENTEDPSTKGGRFVTQSIVYSTGDFDPNVSYTYIYEYAKQVEPGVGSFSVPELTGDDHLPEVVIFGVFDSNFQPVDERLILTPYQEAKINGTIDKNINWINRSGKWYGVFNQLTEGEDYISRGNYENEGPTANVDGETKFLKSGLRKITLQPTTEQYYSQYYGDETKRRASQKGLSSSLVDEISYEIKNRLGTKDSTGASGIQSGIEAALKSSFLTSIDPNVGNFRDAPNSLTFMKKPFKPKKVNFKNQEVWVDVESKYDMKIIKCDSSPNITFLDIEPDNSKLKTTKIIRFIKNTISFRMIDNSEFYYEISDPVNLPIPRAATTIEIVLDNTRGAGILGQLSYSGLIDGILNIYKKFMDSQYENGVIFVLGKQNSKVNSGTGAGSFRLLRFFNTWKIERIYWTEDSAKRIGEIVSLGISNLSTESDDIGGSRIRVKFPNGVDYFFSTYDGQFLYRTTYGDVRISDIQPENLKRAQVTINNTESTLEYFDLPANSIRVEDDRFKFGKLISNTQILNEQLAVNRPYSTGKYGTPITIRRKDGSSKNLSVQSLDQIYRFQQTEDDTETYFIIEGILSSKNKQKLNDSLQTQADGGSEALGNGDYSFPDVIGVIPVFIEMLIDVFAKLIPNINSLLTLISNPPKFVTDIIIAKIGDNNGTEPEKFGIFGKKFQDDLKQLSRTLSSEQAKLQSGIEGALSGVLGQVGGNLSGNLGNLAGNLTSSLQAGLGNIPNIGGSLGDVASNFANSLQSGLGSATNNLTNALGGNLGNISGNLSGLLQNGFNNITGNLGDFQNIVGNIGDVGSALQNNLSNLTNSIGSSVGGSALNSLQNTLSNFTSGAGANFAGSIANFASSISGGSSISFGGIDKNLIGNFASTLGNVGKNLSPNFLNSSLNQVGSSLTTALTSLPNSVQILSNLNPATLESLAKSFNLPNLSTQLSGQQFSNAFNSLQNSLSGGLTNLQGGISEGLAGAQNALATGATNLQNNLTNSFNRNRNLAEEKVEKLRTKLKEFVSKSKLNNYVYITPEGFPYFIFDGVSTIKLFGDAPILEKLPSISFGLETKLTNLALGGIAAPPFNFNIASSVAKASNLFTQLTGKSKDLGEALGSALDAVKNASNQVSSTLSNTLGSLSSLLPFNLIFQYFGPTSDESLSDLSELTKPDEKKTPSNLVNTNLSPVLDIPSQIVDKTDKTNFVYQVVDIQYSTGEKLDNVNYKYTYIYKDLQKQILDAQKLDEAGETTKAVAILEEVKKKDPNNSILNELLNELKKKINSSVQPIIKFMLELVCLPLKIIFGIISYILDVFKSFLNPFELVGKVIDFISFKWMLDFFNPTSKNSIFAILGMKFDLETYLTSFIPTFLTEITLFRKLAEGDSSVLGRITGELNNLPSALGNIPGLTSLQNLAQNTLNNLSPIVSNFQATAQNAASGLGINVNLIPGSLITIGSDIAGGISSNIGSNITNTFKNAQVISNLNQAISSGLGSLGLGSSTNVENNISEGIGKTIGGSEGGLGNNISQSLDSGFASAQGAITNVTNNLSKSFNSIQNDITKSLGTISNSLTNSLPGVFNKPNLNLSRFGSKFDLSKIINMPFFAGKLPTYNLSQFESFHLIRNGLSTISFPSLPLLPKLPSFPAMTISSILCLIEAIINSVIDLIWGILGLGSLIPPPHLKLCRDSNQNPDASDIAKLLSGAFDDPSKEKSTGRGNNGPSYNFVYNIKTSDGRDLRGLNRQELDKWLEENKDLQISFDL